MLLSDILTKIQSLASRGHMCVGIAGCQDRRLELAIGDLKVGEKLFH